ncbi:unnamed protein product, partial [Ceratitis capitata]
KLILHADMPICPPAYCDTQQELLRRNHYTGLSLDHSTWTRRASMSFDRSV